MLGGGAKRLDRRFQGRSNSHVLSTIGALFQQLDKPPTCAKEQVTNGWHAHTSAACSGVRIAHQTLLLPLPTCLGPPPCFTSPAKAFGSEAKPSLLGAPLGAKQAFNG